MVGLICYEGCYILERCGSSPSASPAVPLNHLTLACTRQLTNRLGFSSAFGVLWCVGNPRLSCCGHERPAQLESRLPTAILAAADCNQSALAETWLTQHCCCKTSPTFLTPRRTYSSPSAAPLLHLWLWFSMQRWEFSGPQQYGSTQQASRRCRPERQSKAQYLSCFPFSLHAWICSLSNLLCQAIWDNQCDFSAILHPSQSFSFSFAKGALLICLISLPVIPEVEKTLWL